MEWNQEVRVHMNNNPITKIVLIKIKSVPNCWHCSLLDGLAEKTILNQTKRLFVWKFDFYSETLSATSFGLVLGDCLVMHWFLLKTNIYIVKLSRIKILKIPIMKMWAMLENYALLSFFKAVKQLKVMKNPEHIRWPFWNMFVSDCWLLTIFSLTFNEQNKDFTISWFF